MKFALITMLSLLLLVGCVSSDYDDSWINQTGMAACKYAAATIGVPVTRPEDRAYGEGTVQARQQARDGTVDCVKRLQK